MSKTKKDELTVADYAFSCGEVRGCLWLWEKTKNLKHIIKIKEIIDELYLDGRYGKDRITFSGDVTSGLVGDKKLSDMFKRLSANAKKRVMKPALNNYLNNKIKGYKKG